MFETDLMIDIKSDFETLWNTIRKNDIALTLSPKNQKTSLTLMMTMKKI